MIIAISREFGSGGRELGKRLADFLGILCYDHELIEEVSKQHGMDLRQVERISEQDIRVCYPKTIGNRFSAARSVKSDGIDIASSMREVIRCLASHGDCVIVGRCADVILKDRKPFCMFVYADEPSKIRRCRERAPEGEDFSDSDLRRRIRQIDRGRAAYRALYTEARWGAKESYHLCINTSGKEIKTLVPGIAEYIRVWHWLSGDCDA